MREHLQCTIEGDICCVFAEFTMPPLEEELGMRVIEALTVLVAGNANNAAVFRECGGARCAHSLVPYLECRKEALGIVRELMMGAGGDEDMGILLGMMHSAPPSALELKTHILKVTDAFSIKIIAWNSVII